MWLVGKVPDAGLQSDTLIINANQPGHGDKGMVRTQFQLTRGIADGDTAAAAAAATVVTTQVFAVRIRVNKLNVGDFISDDTTFNR